MFKSKLMQCQINPFITTFLNFVFIYFFIFFFNFMTISNYSFITIFSLRIYLVILQNMRNDKKNEKKIKLEI